MNILSPNHLDEQQISQLLDLDPDAADSSTCHEILAHLEGCEQCRQRLEESAAAPQLWLTASQVLDSEQIEQAESDSHALEAQIQTLLHPPRHPEMLGRIDGFEIESVIGTGGNGIVFKGFDSDLNRPIAVKVLSPRFAMIGAARKRFSREARAAAAICHENVLAIHRIDATADNPFIVMPFVGGGSLQEFVERQGPLDAVQVVQIGQQLAAGLAAAHAVGVIHRDVKPANVLMENRCNRVLLTDFGLAQVKVMSA